MEGVLDWGVASPADCAPAGRGGLVDSGHMMRRSCAAAQLSQPSSYKHLLGEALECSWADHGREEEPPQPGTAEQSALLERKLYAKCLWFPVMVIGFEDGDNVCFLCFEH